MKFVCLTSNLKKALSACDKIVSRNLSLPILSNLLIKTSKDKLQIVSTDLEIGLNYYVLGEVKEEGSIVVPSKLFLGVINNLSDEKITLETKGDKLIIQNKEFNLNIQGFDSSEYPIIPSIESEDFIEIDSNELLSSLNQVSKSANAGFNKPELNSVFLNFVNNEFYFVSTDSFRLSERKINNNFFKTNKKTEVKMIIPVKTILEVMLILQNFDDVDQKTKIYFSNNQVFFDFGIANLISRLIEGEFPNYKNIIPKTYQTKIQINKNKFKESIRLISNLSSQIKDLNIQVDSKNQEIILKGEDANKGDGLYKIKCMIDGYDSKICFNYSYIIDGLDGVDSEEVFFGINEDSPAIIKATNDDNFIYVLMPIRI
jgi:DNA polymerase-3 subunit beta